MTSQSLFNHSFSALTRNSALPTRRQLEVSQIDALHFASVPASFLIWFAFNLDDDGMPWNDFCILVTVLDNHCDALAEASHRNVGIGPLLAGISCAGKKLLRCPPQDIKRPPQVLILR